MTSSNRIWIVVVVVLIAMNIALLATIWLRLNWPPLLPQEHGTMRPPRQPHGAGAMMKSLELTEQQKTAFECERQLHQQRIDSLKKKAKEVREQFFGALIASGNRPNDSLAMMLGTYHMLIEQQTFRHFATVRSMLSNPQKQIFDSSVLFIVKGLQEQPRFRGDGNGPPPPRRGFLPPPPNGDCEDCPPPSDNEPPPHP
jgi:hypothetical protein